MNKMTRGDINQQASDEAIEWELPKIIEYMTGRSVEYETNLRDDFEVARRIDLEYEGEGNDVN